MSRRLWLPVATGAGLLLAGHAVANCVPASNPFDRVYCVGQIYQQADHQLNEDYGALAKLLNPSEQQALRAAEISWIKDRDASCTLVKNRDVFVSIDCATAMTTSRDDFIKARQRECTSTGCVADELAKETD